ncbi:hypothetical protein I552_4011 [Mycobacterium xenopi 3993]|nr:hypothetical protein I552_4011 [Mycobacterium xenopi 3993]
MMHVVLAAVVHVVLVVRVVIAVVHMVVVGMPMIHMAFGRVCATVFTVHLRRLGTLTPVVSVLSDLQQFLSRTGQCGVHSLRIIDANPDPRARQLIPDAVDGCSKLRSRRAAHHEDIGVGWRVSLTPPASG